MRLTDYLMPGLGKKVIMIKSEMELDGEIKGLDSRYGKLCLYFLKIEYLRRQIFLKFYNWFTDALIQRFKTWKRNSQRREGLGFSKINWEVLFFFFFFWWASQERFYFLNYTYLLEKKLSMREESCFLSLIMKTWLLHLLLTSQHESNCFLYFRIFSYKWDPK